MQKRKRRLADGYKPASVPRALRVISGYKDTHVQKEDGRMEVSVVDRPEMRLYAIHIKRSRHEVRRAWKELLGKLNRTAETMEYGYVLIPEWQWSTEVTELWVAVEADGVAEVPEGVQAIVLPARKYAKVTVRGDQRTMENTYGNLWEWFEKSEYERDLAKGSIGFEANRLHPINPFDIPADEIDFFDYDIYAPIKE